MGIVACRIHRGKRHHHWRKGRRGSARILWRDHRLHTRSMAAAGERAEGALDHMRLIARKFSMMRPTQGTAGAGEGGEGGEGMEVWWRRH
jgi:hypothetical protein